MRRSLFFLVSWLPSAQSVSPGNLGVTPTVDPEGVYVLDKTKHWITIGTMTGGVFTPVGGGGGGGCSGTCDVNILSLNGTSLGTPTGVGVPPAGGTNVMTVNAQILNLATLSTAANQATANTTLSSILCRLRPPCDGSQSDFRKHDLILNPHQARGW